MIRSMRDEDKEHSTSDISHGILCNESTRETVYALSNSIFYSLPRPRQPIEIPLLTYSIQTDAKKAFELHMCAVSLNSNPTLVEILNLHQNTITDGIFTRDPYNQSTVHI
jgi:hypothetical protein